MRRIHLELFRYANSFLPGDRGFLLHGPPGGGKTHLMTAFLHRITLEKGIHARFVEFSHLLSSLRQQFDQGKGDTAILQPLVEVEVLSIDELGKGVNNEWQLSVLDELISKRYNLGRTTLFTSNYQLKADSLRYSDVANDDLRRITREDLERAHRRPDLLASVRDDELYPRRRARLPPQQDPRDLNNAPLAGSFVGASLILRERHEPT